MSDYWEELWDHQFMRWFDFNGEPALMEIVRITKGVELPKQDGGKEYKTVIEFEQVQGKIEHVKPLVMNYTNLHTLSRICGPAPSKWPGQEVVLFPTTTTMPNRETRKREEVGCIRIRAKKEA